jgi:hypothetical protein
MLRIPHIAFLLILAHLLFSCQQGEEQAPGLFTLVSPSHTRIDFVNRLTESDEFNVIQYLYFNNGAGVAAGDINNDGLVDLYFTSNQEANRLYLNLGGLRFEEITRKAGVEGSGDWKTGVCMADVNGDGWLDIYVCQVGNYKGIRGRNQLFLNQGDLTFREEAATYGLDFQGFSTQAAFFDYDLDGDLDMYLLNHSVHTSRSYGSADLRLESDERAGDRLYRNGTSEGESRFTDVTQQAGIFSSQIGYGLGISISDINNDGFPDIYVSNDFHENDYLYINQGGGTFSEQHTEMMKHTSRSSMGNDVGDMNNDGLLDVVVLDMLPDEEQILKQSGGEDDYELFNIKLAYGYSYQYVRNMLQLNLGGGTFSEIGRYAGIDATDWSWSPLFCDVDNDGWKDLFITNGIYRRANDLDYVEFLTGGNRDFPMRDNSAVSDRELYEKMPLYPHVNFLFRNNGDLTFTNMAQKWGFGTRTYSNGSTYADLDNDGDLELVVNNINGPADIYQNHARDLTGHHFLTVVLEGQGLNTTAVGTRVTLHCGDQKLVAEQFSTRGFMSSTSHVLHFGLGEISVIDSMEVRWPGRTQQIYREVPVDQRITLSELEWEERWVDKSTPERPILFKLYGVPGLEYMHLEDGFADQERERLIPHNLSAEGPPIAVGDINGDGMEDLFVGSAAGQPAGFFIQQRGGIFRQNHASILNNDRLTEDVDAAFFDAEGDGDLDLYVVRGGNEVPPGDPLLADRLLINDGKGGFTRCRTGAIPYMAANGSCVRPCDYDGDGDVDLFVGTRSFPGAYGLSPDQFLLENDGMGNFRHLAEEKIPGLKGMGMVTDASWVDDDMDGDMDLVVVGEWMAVTLLRNEGGSFSDGTLTAGLGETSGWWNCIRSVDVDGDGDPDLAGGNLGQNTMWKASPEEPVELYVNDFDNNGSPEPLICSFREGKSFPIATLDEMEAQMPGLKATFSGYAAFGGKTARDIFGAEKLENAYHRSALFFSSALFLNNGDGTYTIGELPGVAQFSPVRDIESGDVNLDGRTDLLLAGNDYTARPSLGRYDASYGWCLLGDGEGEFIPLMPVESGLKIEGDARRIRWIRIDGQLFLLAAVNDGPLQLFRTGPVR